MHIFTKYITRASKTHFVQEGGTMASIRVGCNKPELMYANRPSLRDSITFDGVEVTVIVREGC